MDWKQKLSSRKLWACVVGVLMGAAIFFGVDGDSVSTVAGAVTSLISVVAYIHTEGKIDAAAVNTAYEDITEIVDAVLDALEEVKAGGSE